MSPLGIADRMIVTPHKGYQKYRWPLFIVRCDFESVTILTSAGEFTTKRLDELQRPRPSERAIYSCVDLDTLCTYGDPTLWTIRTWNGRVSSATYGDIKIYPLLSQWDESIWSLFELIDSFNIAASSLNTMSLNLWRTTLTSTVSFVEEAPYELMLGPVAMQTGGRKEARRGTYRNRVEYDMVAAYPNAMEVAFPSRLYPIADKAFIRGMDLSKWNGSTLVSAKVRIPPREWGPLPVVLDPSTNVSCYGYTKANEWTDIITTLSELRTAVEITGVDVILRRIAMGRDYSTYFARWLHDVVPLLRALPLGGGTVGKLIANRLWSCFAVTPIGDRREHRFSADGNMHSVVLPQDSPDQILRRGGVSYIGAIVQSRVRERLLREGLYGSFKGVVYVDTDGLVARPTDNIPDGWRAKTEMRYVDIAGPQAMFYKCSQCRTTGAIPYGANTHANVGHWTVAGAESIEAKSKLFQLMKHDGFIMANIGNVLPPQDVNEYGKESESEKDSDSSSALLDYTGTFT